MKSISSLIGLWLIFFVTCLWGQGEDGYKLPPAEIVNILTAPQPPDGFVSPDGGSILLAQPNPMPDLKDLAQPMLRLAGIRLNPNQNGRFTTRFYSQFRIQSLAGNRSVTLKFSSDLKMGVPVWSADGHWIAVSVFRENGIELWLADPVSGNVRALTGPVLNEILFEGFKWMPENRSILAFIIDENREKVPQAPVVPSTPVVQETTGKLAKVPTYQDLLTDPFDHILFDYYSRAQVVVIDIGSGEIRKIGLVDMYADANPSPDGQYILITRLKKPFSYQVPYYYFAQSVEVWNLEGKVVRKLVDKPVADDIPIGGVVKGLRNIIWQALRPSTLLWVEALDEGDPEKEVPFRDWLMILPSPFEGNPTDLIRIKNRLQRLYWLGEAGKLLFSDYDWKKKWITVNLVNIDNNPIEAKLIYEINEQDQYNHPGNPAEIGTVKGEKIVAGEKSWIYLDGWGATPDGDRPFLQMLNLDTLEKKIVFRCDDSSYEYFVDFAGSNLNRLITKHESPMSPPNYYLRHAGSSTKKNLSNYRDPAPALRGIKKQLIKYTRNDGVSLSGILYLPAGYRTGQRLPGFIWAYPIEYNDPKVAGQVRGSQNRFAFFRGPSHLFLATQGYAVLDQAQMPIIGDPKTMNDTFTEQIVANAQAAVDVLDKMGVIDPKRVAVGGHSYGAFMTANLLAHSDIFAAGIARSGAYNRTLTPFGFQSERRTLWEAPQAYFKTSPLMHADKIKEPLLLIHGQADNNSGTFPIQSERLFHAIGGFGGKVRLVLLPFESHGYQARESVFHVLYEMITWLNIHLKEKK